MSAIRNQLQLIQTMEEVLNHDYIGIMESLSNNESYLNEAFYDGMIGMMEIAKFMKQASDEYKKKFKELVDQGENKEAWEIVKSVISDED